MYLNYTYPVNLHTGKNPNLYPFKYNGSTEKQINLLNLEKKSHCVHCTRNHWRSFVLLIILSRKTEECSESMCIVYVSERSGRSFQHFIRHHKILSYFFLDEPCCYLNSHTDNTNIFQRFITGKIRDCIVALGCNNKNQHSNFSVSLGVLNNSDSPDNAMFF